jgi:hypothetical protein
MADAMQELRWALQALAQPAAVQLQLFPKFVCKADELALDFDNWCAVVQGQQTLTTEQRSALQSLDSLLMTTSGRHNAPHWSDEALRHDPLWEEVRELARNALASFGWSSEVPPSNRSVYVSG